jgi:MtaA/CmuA family methyltransferase
MTGKERLRAAVRMTEPDRVPVFPIAHYFSAAPAKISVKTYATQAEAMAAALIGAVERFGWDGVQPGCDVTIEAEAMGSLVQFPEDAPPYVVRPVLRDPANLGKLKRPNPLRDGRMSVIVRATEICAREIGGQVYVGPFLGGPFNFASQLRGVADLMMDIADRPEFVETLLDFCTDILIDFGIALIDAGADAVFLGEALCSPGMISPRYYARTIAPRQKRMISAFNKYNPDCHTAMHICGQATPILSTIIETGVNIADLDWQVDMVEAKRICARRMAIRGNLDPAKVLLQASAGEVYRSAADLIRAVGPGGGFILGSGCDVALTTPFENLDAMMAAAKETTARKGSAPR